MAQQQQPEGDNSAIHYGAGGTTAAGKAPKGHYDILWGQDNIHLGFYPHLEGGLVMLNFEQAAVHLTERMIRLAKIDHTSTVLDLGCGKGIACQHIAERTGARCMGLDLTQANIDRATEIARQSTVADQQLLEYAVGSFTELPPAVTARKYSLIWSQVALCHAHKELPQIFEQAKSVLAPGGALLIVDYLGDDTPYTSASGAHFPHLHGHVAWRKAVDESGLILMHYENLDKHMAQAYADLAVTADFHGFMMKDGVRPMSEGYREAVELINTRRMGMNMALLAMPEDAGAAACGGGAARL